MVETLKLTRLIPFLGKHEDVNYLDMTEVKCLIFDSFQGDYYENKNHLYPFNRYYHGVILKLEAASTLICRDTWWVSPPLRKFKK